MEDKGIFLVLKDVSVLWKFMCTVGGFFALSDKVKWLASVNSETEDICYTKESYVISLVYVNIPNLSCLCMKTPACSVTSPEYLPDR